MLCVVSLCLLSIKNGTSQYPIVLSSHLSSFWDYGETSCSVQNLPFSKLLLSLLVPFPVISASEQDLDARYGKLLMPAAWLYSFSHASCVSLNSSIKAQVNLSSFILFYRPRTAPVWLTKLHKYSLNSIHSVNSCLTTQNGEHFNREPGTYKFNPCKECQMFRRIKNETASTSALSIVLKYIRGYHFSNSLIDFVIGVKSLNVLSHIYASKMLLWIFICVPIIKKTSILKQIKKLENV